MQALNDAELLADYATRRSEAAFARLVERYVALVHSAARRQVSDPHLAEEITQAVFILLARKAGSLGRQTVLAGWLCRTAHFAARDALRTERRRQHREQLAATMDTTPDAAWQQLAPLLDEAVAQLREADRNAIVLRYYEQRSLDEVGAALGIGADAAQKRVTRALERLRGIFAKRGVTLAGAAIGGAVSANAVQAVPVGLAAKVSAAALVAGTTLATTTAITMTMLQKTLLGTALAAAVGVGIYEARQASIAQVEVEALRQRQTPLAEQVQQLTRERDDATNLLAGLREEVERLSRNTPELLRLRGEVARLREVSSEPGHLRTNTTQTNGDPIALETENLASKVHELKEWLALHPEQNIPELQLLSVKNWVQTVMGIPHWGGTERDFVFASSVLRTQAKEGFAPQIGTALADYVIANNGQLPNDLTELKRYFQPEISDEILRRYALLHKGDLRSLPSAETLITERATATTGQYDTLVEVGVFGWTCQRVNALGSDSHGDFPGTSQLRNFVKK